MPHRMDTRCGDPRCWQQLALIRYRIPSVLWIIGLIILVGCQGPGSLGRISSARTPSIVILLADDAGYVDFGFTGLMEITTPNIDRIAAEGVVCSQGYVCASVCSPSRAGLLTGKYPQRFGHEMNLPAGSQLGLPLSQQTVADHLQQNGYRTGIIGKWHLGEEPPYRPLQRGFDEFRGFLGGARTYLDRKNLSRRTRWLDGEENADLSTPYVTDAIGDEASRFVNDHREVPFFLFVSFNAVHTPMQALKSDLDAIPTGVKGKRRKNLAMTKALDRAVGKILNTIDDCGISDNTIVFFINDNGGATSNASDNGPHRGMKGSKFEGGIRVPWATRWPAKIPAGTRFEEPVSTLDIATTIMAAAKVPTPDPSDLDGVDILDQLTGTRSDPPHEFLFWRRSVAAAVRSGPWKLIRVEGLSPQLFHLQQDPGERIDLSAQQPQVVEQLLARLSLWEQGLVDPAWSTGKIWRRNQIEKHRIDFIGRENERSKP